MKCLNFVHCHHQRCRRRCRYRAILNRLTIHLRLEKKIQPSVEMVFG